MDSRVMEFARPRRGHFELGTGYHGDAWLGLDALFPRPARLEPHVEWLAGTARRVAGWPAARPGRFRAR